MRLLLDASAPQRGLATPPRPLFSVQNSAISLGFAVGPLLGAAVEESVQIGAVSDADGAGFRAMSLAFGVACLGFAPCLCVLRKTETMAADSEDSGQSMTLRLSSATDSPLSFDAVGFRGGGLQESLLTAPIIHY